MTVTHKTVQTNGINMHIVTEGEGPLVIMCHGFPGLAYSWRHQMTPIAEAGYTAVAIDQRGYGRSDRPTDPAVYDSNHTVGDLIGLLTALGQEKAVFIGHDFGAAQVYNIAVRHPELVAGVIGMACPYDFDLAGRGGAGLNPPKDQQYPRTFALPYKKPSDCYADIAKNHFIHMHYFQEIGPAEKELGARPRDFLMRDFWALSGDGSLLDWTQFPGEGIGYLDALAEPSKPLPWSWLSQQDMDFYVNEYTNSEPGSEFIGGLHSYRAADRNWEISKPYADNNIEAPSLFISGAEDPVLQMIGGDALEILQQRSTDLRGIEIVAGAGHFVQQEKPDQTNKAILSFLKNLTND